MKQTWLECVDNEQRAEFLGLRISGDTITHISSGRVVQAIPANRILAWTLAFLQGWYRCTELRDILENKD